MTGEDPNLWLMSNLRAHETGVDAVLWISAGEFEHSESKHGPRMLVMLGDVASREALDAAVAVKLTAPPEILGRLAAPLAAQVIAFAAKHRDALLRHWRGEIDTMETLRAMGLL